MSLALALVSVAGASDRGSTATESFAPEYMVKAAFVYNFARFVEWPPDAFSGSDAPLVICVLGDEPLEGAFKAMEVDSVRGRPLIVKRCDDFGDTGDCHVVFVCRSERKNVARILSHFGHSHVLTVGDVSGFAEAGGAIDFVLQDDRLRFRVNTAAIKSAGLRASSRMLKLAEIVG